MIRHMVGSNSEEILNATKADFSKLTPCRRSQIPYKNRANYKVSQWKQSHEKMPSLLIIGLIADYG